MMMIKSKKFCSYLLILFLAGTFVTVRAENKANIKRPTLILISLDGYRYDYSDIYKPENIVKFSSEGVRAKWMIPSFPTKTFPNHYTIVTGLYPQNHGIVENNVWDHGTIFTMSKKNEVQNPRWWLGEPVWVSAAMQNISTGAFFFPGTEAEIKGFRPKYWRTYEHELKYEERVDTILSWLDEPIETRPQLYTLYFDEPDSAGHNYGPISKQTGEAVKRVDQMIGRLITGLKQRGIYNDVNIIITSDHGMANVSNKETIILDEKVDLDLTERVIWGGEIVQIFPKSGNTQKLISDLSKIKNIKCWEKGKIPSRLNYNSGPRVAPIVCSADIGYTINNRSYFEQTIKKRINWDGIRGAHGYDNKHKEMRAFFTARGPDFRSGHVVKPFKNVDVYELMCKILGIKPAINDGKYDRIKHVLKNK